MKLDNDLAFDDLDTETLKIDGAKSEQEVKNALESLRQEWAIEPFKNIHSTTMALGQACALGNWKDISECFYGNEYSFSCGSYIINTK